jgi:Tfp pilus assembly protein PilV
MIEVLIATAILAVALLGIASMFPTGYTNLAHGGQKSRAVALAQKETEWIKNSAVFPPAGGACSSPVPGGFTCSKTVTLAGAAPNQLATATVTVAWAGSPRSGIVSMVTQIAE